MIDELQEGDTVIITDLTRISRSTKDLLNKSKD
ncbi:recombinase family protein (plasmid) [Clostridium perfringens]